MKAELPSQPDIPQDGLQPTALWIVSSCKRHTGLKTDTPTMSACFRLGLRRSQCMGLGSGLMPLSYNGARVTEEGGLPPGCSLRARTPSPQRWEYWLLAAPRTSLRTDLSMGLGPDPMSLFTFSGLEIFCPNKSLLVAISSFHGDFILSIYIILSDKRKVRKEFSKHNKSSCLS